MGSLYRVSSSEFHSGNCCPKHWEQGWLGEVSTRDRNQMNTRTEAGEDQCITPRLSQVHFLHPCSLNVFFYHWDLSLLWSLSTAVVFHIGSTYHQWHYYIIFTINVLWGVSLHPLDCFTWLMSSNLRSSKSFLFCLEEAQNHYPWTPDLSGMALLFPWHLSLVTPHWQIPCDVSVLVLSWKKDLFEWAMSYHHQEAQLCLCCLLTAKRSPYRSVALLCQSHRSKDSSISPSVFLPFTCITSSFWSQLHKSYYPPW